MTRFLTLQDYLLPPPLAALAAAFICLGLVNLGERLAAVFRRGTPGVAERAAGFVIATGLAGAACHAMAAFGVARLAPLRVMGGVLGALGIYGLVNTLRGDAPRRVRGALRSLRAEPASTRVAAALAAVSLFSLLLAAMGPPTDADSLDYHLGVPLEILRHHTIEPRPDWLHARLVGLGEFTNLLGLAAGTDGLGAMLQFAGLLALLAAMLAGAAGTRERVWGMAAVMTSPVLLFLIPNQKPQMLPVAATTIAFILISRRRPPLDTGAIALAAGSIGFAMACKSSFIVSGAVLMAAGAVAARSARRQGAAVLSGMISLGIFLLPVLVEKFRLYGDPISPFLERFRPQGDQVVVNFAAFLRSYRDSSLPIPLSWFLPDSAHTLTATLAVAFVPILISAARKAPGLLLQCILPAGFLTCLLGQPTARFLLEPFLWATALVLATGGLKPGRALSAIILAQGTAVAAMAVFGAVTLFPGALTSGLRDRVMARSANGYQVCRWLDATLPADSVVLTELRSRALIPRRFYGADHIAAANQAGAGGDFAELAAMIRRQGINTWVGGEEGEEPEIARFFPVRVAGPASFRWATRNPWNTSTRRIGVYRVAVPGAAGAPIGYNGGR